MRPAYVKPYVKWQKNDASQPACGVSLECVFDSLPKLILRPSFPVSYSNGVTLMTVGSVRPAPPVDRGLEVGATKAASTVQRGGDRVENFLDESFKGGRKTRRQVLDAACDALDRRSKNKQHLLILLSKLKGYNEKDQVGHINSIRTHMDGYVGVGRDGQFYGLDQFANFLSRNYFGGD